MDCMMDEAFGGLVLYWVFVAIVQHEKSEICSQFRTSPQRMIK